MNSSHKIFSLVRRKTGAHFVTTFHILLPTLRNNLSSTGPLPSFTELQSYHKLE